MTVLAMQQVRFAFPGWPATVDGADLAVEEGAFHCLVGRSGCGKTTLLKLAAGLLVPDAGRIAFRPRTPDALGRDIGFVFQSPNLLEWLRVVDNVLLPVTLHRRATEEERTARGASPNTSSSPATSSREGSTPTVTTNPSGTSKPARRSATR